MDTNRHLEAPLLAQRELFSVTVWSASNAHMPERRTKVALLVYVEDIFKSALTNFTWYQLSIFP